MSAELSEMIPIFRVVRVGPRLPSYMVVVRLCTGCIARVTSLSRRSVARLLGSCLPSPTVLRLTRFEICITQNLLRPSLKTVRNPTCLSKGPPGPLVLVKIC